MGICHSTESQSAWWPKNEMNELRAMISSDVPAAIACGVPKKRTSAGIARNPPPIPKRPVIEPIKSAIKCERCMIPLLGFSRFHPRSEPLHDRVNPCHQTLAIKGVETDVRFSKHKNPNPSIHHPLNRCHAVLFIKGWRCPLMFARKVLKNDS